MENLDTNLIVLVAIFQSILIILLCFNLIKRRKSEARLKENDTFLKLALEGVNLGFWELNLPERDLLISGKFGEVFGKDNQPKKIPLAGWTKKLHPDDHDAFMDHFESCVSGESPLFKITARMITPKGNWNWYLFFGRIVFFNRENDPIKMMGLILNINEQKKAEDEVRKNDKEFRKLIEEMPIMMGKIDNNRNILFWNKECERVTGYSSQEALAESLNPKILELNFTEYKDIQDLLDSKKEAFKDVELEFECKDGSKRIISCSNTKLKPKDEGWVSWTFGVDITKRKNFEKALKESEFRHRTLFETINQGVIYITPKGEILSANPAALKMFGFSMEEFKGENCFGEKWKLLNSQGELIKNEDHPLTTAIKEKRIIYDYVMGILIPKLGEHTWYNITIIPVFHPGADEPYQIYGCFEDITSKRKAERKLKESELKYRKFFETMPLGVARFKVIFNSNREVCDALCMEANKYFETISGFSKVELEGSRALELLPDFESPIIKRLGRVALEGEQIAFENYKYYDGRYLSISSYSPEYEYFILFINDQTKRKKAEFLLKKSESRYRELFESMSQGVAYYDKEGNVTSINTSFYEILDLKIEDRSPAKIKGILERSALFDEKGKLIPLMERPGMTALRTGKSVLDYVINFRTLRGREIWVKVDAIPFFKSEEVTGAYLAIENITKEKQAELGQQILISELKNKNTELERFIYTVSHDLKTPLITVKGFLWYLEQDFNNQKYDRINENIEKIANAADGMYKMLEELLEISRIGRLINKEENFSISELIPEVLGILDGKIDQNKVDIEITPNLPFITADRIRILEVLQNLIDNAIKYMGEQKNPRIEVGYTFEDGRPVCFIRDNGMGINPRYKDKVFDLFEKITPESEGTGVGLAIVKRVIEVHQGKLWVESAGENMGSCFYFTTPTMRLLKE